MVIEEAIEGIGIGNLLSLSDADLDQLDAWGLQCNGEFSRWVAGFVQRERERRAAGDKLIELEFVTFPLPAWTPSEQSDAIRDSFTITRMSGDASPALREFCQNVLGCCIAFARSVIAG